MPDDAMTRDELLRRARDAHREYQGAVAAVPEDRILEPGAIGDNWSVRDVIAHIGADEMWMAGQLEALASDAEPTVDSVYGREPPPRAGIDLSTQDGRNAWQYERLRDLPLDEVRAMAETSHARLIAAIEAMPDDVYGGELAIVPLGVTQRLIVPSVGEHAFPVWQWLRGVTFHHYADHAADIRAFAERARG